MDEAALQLLILHWCRSEARLSGRSRQTLGLSGAGLVLAKPGSAEQMKGSDSL